MTEKPKLNSPNTIKKLEKQYKRAKKHNKNILITKKRYILNSSSGSGSSGYTEIYRECNYCGGVYFDTVPLCIHYNTDRDCGAWAERCSTCRTVLSFVACQCPKDPPVVTAAPAAPSL
jgi:hypothetical protein